MSVTKTSFGTTKAGQKTSLYTIASDKLSLDVTDYGATVVALRVPDKEGRIRDVILGYDNAGGYESGTDYLGTTVGRNANRIKDAEILIGGKRFLLGKNDGNNNLHSGPDTWHTRLYTVSAVTENSVTFSLISPDLDQGFPGELDFSVTFTLNGNRLEIHYEAEADKDTVINVTNHSYFNLNGEGSGSVLDHHVWINADAYTESDAALIPTGRIIPVEGTPYDFRERHPLGQYIYAPGKDPEKTVINYDTNFALNASESGLAANAYSSESGILMNVYTDLPGVQVFVPAVFDKIGKNGVNYREFESVCFETQMFPDAIHQPGFASPIVRAGDKFESTTVYAFETITV